MAHNLKLHGGLSGEVVRYKGHEKPKAELLKVEDQVCKAHVRSSLGNSASVMVPE